MQCQGTKLTIVNLYPIQTFIVALLLSQSWVGSVGQHGLWYDKNVSLRILYKHFTWGHIHMQLTTIYCFTDIIPLSGPYTVCMLLQYLLNGETFNSLDGSLLFGSLSTMLTSALQIKQIIFTGVAYTHYLMIVRGSNQNAQCMVVF